MDTPAFTLQIQFIPQKEGYSLIHNAIPLDIREHYEFDFSTTNVVNLLDRFQRIDVQSKTALREKKALIWNIQFKNKKVISTRYPNLVSHLIWKKNSASTLLEFQKVGVDWLLNQQRGILADDMGLGKTVQTLRALATHFFKDKINNSLILCPNSLQENWSTELDIWTNNLEYFNFAKIGNRSIKSILNNYNVIIAPYSKLTNIASSLSEADITLDILIADEAHKLRNQGSSVNRAFSRIKSNKTWMLTGTPLERDSKDIVNILNLLDRRLGYSHERVEKLILKSTLSKVSLRRLKIDVLSELPQAKRTYHYLDMVGEQHDNYKKIKNSIFKVPVNQRISFITQLAIAACSGKGHSSNKINFSIKLVKELISKNEKCIIFSNFNGVLKKTGQALSQAGITNNLFTGEQMLEERRLALKRFKEDAGSSVLLLNSRLGGEGLTLTAANNVIFLNEWWNPSSNRQAEDRVNRIGQSKPINIHVLRSNNTIDTAIEAILETKTRLEKEFINLLVDRL